ncbi:MAG: sulfatase [Bacteroidota bacterium]
MRLLPSSRDALVRVGLLVGPLVVFVVGLRLAGWRGPRMLNEAGAFTIALSDAAVLAGLAGVAVAVLRHACGWGRVLVVAGLYGGVVALGVLAVFQYGYAEAFGFPLDPYVLFVHSSSSDAASLAGIVAAEMTPLRIVLLCTPLLLVIGAALSVRRRDAQDGPPPRLSRSMLLGLGSLVLAGLGGRSGEYAWMVRPLPEAPWGPVPASTASAFDARETRAVATDSTQTFNVVVIILESVRAISTGPWGGPVPTPTLDALAARGLVVDEMLAMTPYTNKTIGAMLSGVIPSPETRLRANRPGGLPAVGLPDLLQPHGYRSAFVTPAWLRFERKDVILDNLGYETLLGAEVFTAQGAEQLDRRAFGVDDGDAIAPALEWTAEQVREGHPFLLTLLTLSGHYPYAIPDESPRLAYAADDEPLVDYLNAVAHTDRAIGDLVDGLDRLGVMDSTLIVVVGDHGQSFGEHGYFAHGDGLYQEALHVPGLVVGPGIAPGRVRGPRQLTDLVPTVADALGLRLEDARLSGRSLLAPPDPDRWLFFASHHEHVATAARWGRWKAVCMWTCRDMEIYDLARDPTEAEDLAATWPQARRDSIGAAMAAWRASVRAAYP